MFRLTFWLLSLAILSHSVMASNKIIKQPDMLGLRTVIYEVTDLSQGIDWYSEAFGIGPYVNTPQYVGFNIRGF
jgi:hypothetical protein